MRAFALLVAALSLLALLPSAQAPNFGTHAGVANGLFADPYFRAGALLADLDHWLPATEPSTDTYAFAQGLLQRTWLGSRNAWRFVDGWYEHLDADDRFPASIARIQATFPSYAVTDVRLAFDYWTLREHPFPANHDWVLGDTEILALVQGGLVGTDLTGVRAAADQLLHSTNLSAPGLALQMEAALTYGGLNPTRVADMRAEYERFWWLTATRFVPPLPRLDVSLRVMAGTVSRTASNPAPAMGFLRAAADLEALRPPNWMAAETSALTAFIDALPEAGLPSLVRWSLQDRAESVIDFLS